MIFVTFFALKILSNLLRKYKISFFLREYRLNALVLVMLFQGNVQVFSYHFIFDSGNTISWNFQQKIINSLTALFFWLTIIYIFSGIFLIRYAYQKLAKYFLDNYENSLKGVSMYFLALFIIEVCFIIVMITLIRKSVVVISKTTEWVKIIASFLRINLIFSYYIDQNSPGKYQPVEQFQMIVLIIYLLVFIVSTFIQIIIVIWKLVKIILNLVNGNEKDCLKT